MSKIYKNGLLKKKNPYKSPKIRIFEKFRSKIRTSGNTACAALSANGSHTVHRKTKFSQTQRELDAPGVLRSLLVRGKLINRVPNANCLQTVWFACSLLVCTGLNISFLNASFSKAVVSLGVFFKCT